MNERQRTKAETEENKTKRFVTGTQKWTEVNEGKGRIERIVMEELRERKCGEVIQLQQNKQTNNLVLI